MIRKYILNKESYYGRGSIEILKTFVSKEKCKKVFIITDNIIVESKNLEKLLQIMNESNVNSEVYSNVIPNPPIRCVDESLILAKEYKPDLIIGLGGGSVMDVAKVVALMYQNPEIKDVRELEKKGYVEKEAFPFILIPTTNGTGSESTITAIITNEEEKLKFVIQSPSFVPKVIIVDADFTDTMSDEIAASTGMDALTHAIEAFTTKNAWELSDMYSLQAIKLIYNNIKLAVIDKDKEAIESMALAQNIAGMGFSNTGLGIVHSLAHPLGAVYNTPHGIANAMLLPYVIRFNGEKVYEKYRKILIEAIGIDARYFNKEDIIKELSEQIEKLNLNLGLKEKLYELKVKREDLPMLAEKALSDGCTRYNPVDVTKEDLISIYEKAYE